MRESLTATAAYRVETWSGNRFSAVQVECLPGRPSSSVEEPLEDCLRDRRRHGGAETVQLLLDLDRDDEARVVRRGEADEPGVVDARNARLRRPGLARHRDARDLGRRAGAALDDELHHLVQLGS